MSARASARIAEYADGVRVYARNVDPGTLESRIARFVEPSGGVVTRTVGKSKIGSCEFRWRGEDGTVHALHVDYPPHW